MRGKWRRWWPAVKWLLGLAILVLIGRQFARDLQRPDLWQRPLHPGWLVVAGLLYLLGIGCSAVYWRRLLGHLGPRPPLLTAARAYYVGHLAKYLPGKAWAVFVRASLVRPAGVSLGVATLTTFYEVLTTMAAGALVATVLFPLVGTAAVGAPHWDTLRQLARLETPPEGVPTAAATLLSLLLLLATGGPLLPPVFNRLAHHLSLPFRGREVVLPRIQHTHLAEGLLLASAGWLLLGASLGAALHAILGPELPWSVEGLGRLAAIMGLSYVAGFVIVVAPGGLGVREFCLTLFLAPELAALGLETDAARAVAVLAVLVLRLVWTLAELVMAGLLYWLPVQRGTDSE
ncbi:MAG TPA: lysylphosphatidylglycerol synthase transmembrane domain-containing protein [Gemmataceae bacterium]|jgi:hypothetical protein|nr:lysylphosphatidylglycerol synthase transmembrane domain-containing protein [Gemmataceae bacterium]